MAKKKKVASNTNSKSNISKRRKRRKIRNIICLVTGLLFTILTITLIVFLKMLNILPDVYFTIVFVILGIITFVIDFFLLLRFKNKLFRFLKYVFLLITIILIGCYSYGIYSLNKTLNLFDNIMMISKEVSNYYIVVLSSSKYKETSDLDGHSVSYYFNTDKKVLDSIKMDLDYSIENDLIKMKDKLINGDVDAIIVSDIVLNRYEEDDEEFSSKIRVLETISISSEIEDITKKVTMKNTPFSVLISGIDTYGDINITSRNDVNIVATVNPNTNEILLTSIPRDYYVQLHGTTGPKDKLTHASYYGINMAVQTIEDILDIDINYYVKVNFTTVVELVDEVGGVEINSDRYLYLDGCNVRKGINTLNGKCALAYARERKSYEDGDRHRGRNQQDIITAIFKKLTSGTTIITEYNNIIDVLNGKFATNMDMNDVSEFIKYEVGDLGSYTIKSIQLDGYGSSGETYSYPGQDLWIMIPYEDTITNAKTLIGKMLKNEKIN